MSGIGDGGLACAIFKFMVYGKISAGTNNYNITQADMCHHGNLYESATDTN